MMSNEEINRIGKVLGRNLQNLMIKRGWTQQRLADKMGVSKTTIMYICQGRGAGSRLWLIMSLADEFDLSIDELCREEFKYD